MSAEPYSTVLYATTDDWKRQKTRHREMETHAYDTSHWTMAERTHVDGNGRAHANTHTHTIFEEKRIKEQKPPPQKRKTHAIMIKKIKIVSSEKKKRKCRGGGAHSLYSTVTSKSASSRTMKQNAHRYHSTTVVQLPKKADSFSVFHLECDILSSLLPSCEKKN